MHELSIAIDPVQVACAEAQPWGELRIQVLQLQVGPLSGIANEALLFSFDLATVGTVSNSK